MTNFYVNNDNTVFDDGDTVLHTTIAQYVLPPLQYEYNQLISTDMKYTELNNYYNGWISGLLHRSTNSAQIEALYNDRQLVNTNIKPKSGTVDVSNIVLIQLVQCHTDVCRDAQQQLHTAVKTLNSDTIQYDTTSAYYIFGEFTATGTPDYIQQLITLSHTDTTARDLLDYYSQKPQHQIIAQLYTTQSNSEFL